MTGCASLSGPTAVDSDVPCAASDARLVDVETVAKDPASYLGECIAIRGVFDGDDIFGSVQRAKLGGEEPYEAKSEFSIGGYIDYSKLESGALWQGRFWGRLETCRDAYNNLPAPPDGTVYIDRWIFGCQHGQLLHLRDLRHGQLTRLQS